MGMLNKTVQSTVPVQLVDTTSYIYNSVNQNVPLTDYFLDFKYLSSSDTIKTKIDFNTKLLKKENSNIDYSNSLRIEYSDFILVLIIFLFALLAYVRFTGKNYLRRLSTSIFNYSYSLSFFKEKNLAYVLNSNILTIVFLVSSAIMIDALFIYYNIAIDNLSKWLLFPISLGIMILALVLHNFIHRFCGKLFGQYRIVLEYLFYFNNMLKISGITYLILITCVYFSYDSWRFLFVYLTIFVTVIIYFIKITRVLMILFNNRFSLYYMILYFCALEIVPVMFFIKILMLISRNNLHFFNILV